MNQRGILIVISGFAGSGKGTLMKRLVGRYPNYALSISATTRCPRPGDVDGREYFFKTKEEFEEMIRQDAFIEYASYVNHYYGTPKRYVEEQLQAGRDVILEIDIQGALQVKKAFPETLLLFVTPPNAQILQERLVGRGTEEAETIRKRLRRAREEADGIGYYDYIIVNDDLEACVLFLHSVIQTEHRRTFRNREFISRLQEGLTNLPDV
jgi:guanylate kinase